MSDLTTDDQHPPALPHEQGHHADHHAHTPAHQSPAHGAGAHDAHAGHDPSVFLRRLWLTLLLTVPVLVFSPGLQDILGFEAPRVPGDDYISAVFGTIVYVYGGRVFLAGAVGELRARAPGMMTLISLAITVALLYSVAVTLGLEGADFWWELATLVTIMLLGHWLELSAVQRANDALSALARLLPDTAEVVDGDRRTHVSVASLTPGTVVAVRPGAAVPADGVVTEGTSDVDESFITGESRPVPKSVGDEVVGGSVNRSGSLLVTVARVGPDTTLSGIMRLVEDAQRSKTPTQVLADRAAGLLFYVALGAALVTLVTWAVLRPDEPTLVLERVVTVLIIACPHALGLAIPLVVKIASARAARHGVLLRNQAALEDARRVAVVLFDKTGTLTRGEQGVNVVENVPGGALDPEEMLRLAASVERDSEHAVGRAIVRAAADRGLTPSSAGEFRAHPGRGVTAVVDGRTITVGSSRVLAESGAITPPATAALADEWSAAGLTTVFVLAGDQLLGMVGLSDQIRPEAREAVDALRSSGKRVAMLTGDSRAVAEWVAARLGITEVYAEVLPDQKVGAVTRLQAGGSRVAMVGDGVNDAPALVQADLGLAIGSGTDVAISSADVLLAASDPRGVPTMIRLSAAGYRIMRQNLAWAVGYNAIAIPLAGGAATGLGIVVGPAVAAALMSISTIIVALNAQTLRLRRIFPRSTSGRRLGADE